MMRLWAPLLFLTLCAGALSCAGGSRVDDDALVKNLDNPRWQIRASAAEEVRAARRAVDGDLVAINTISGLSESGRMASKTGPAQPKVHLGAAGWGLARDTPEEAMSGFRIAVRVPAGVRRA